MKNEEERKCNKCGKELGLSEGNYIPIFIPATLDFNLDSGGVQIYCNKCYEDITGKSFEKELNKSESIIEMKKNLFPN